MWSQEAGGGGWDPAFPLAGLLGEAGAQTGTAPLGGWRLPGTSVWMNHRWHSEAQG